VAIVALLFAQPAVVLELSRQHRVPAGSDTLHTTIEAREARDHITSRSNFHGCTKIGVSIARRLI
jgi:hypothetical protein